MTDFTEQLLYIYLKKDLDLIRHSVDNGCGKDAPGNLAHYMVVVERKIVGRYAAVRFHALIQDSSRVGRENVRRYCFYSVAHYPVECRVECRRSVTVKPENKARVYHYPAVVYSPDRRVVVGSAVLHLMNSADGLRRNALEASGYGYFTPSKSG